MLMGAAGIKKRFMNATLDDFEPKYRQQFTTDKGLFLTGPRGVGKTHLMAAMIRQEILDKEPESYTGTIKHADPVYEYLQYYRPDEYAFPLFISVPELLLEIRGTFGQRYIDPDSGPPDTEASIISFYSRYKVLYLDDLGAEKASDWVRSTLYLLINRRYENERRTVISSNLSLDQLADQLDDRIASRISEMCKIVKIAGSDRRIK
jgi:DNA replication protein DnaC